MCCSKVVKEVLNCLTANGCATPNMHTPDSDQSILLIWVCPFGQVTSRILSGLMFLSLRRCFAMSQKRLVANPNLGIMDIQGVILGHWNKYKDFDLLTFLECPDHQKWSWKTAPNCCMDVENSRYDICVPSCSSKWCFTIAKSERGTAC